MEEILGIKDLSFTYDSGKKALDHISMTVKKGERIAVLGPNGSGKSTFFLNLNGVLMPDEGEIYFRQEYITKKKLNHLRKHVGMVFQDADSQIIAGTVMEEVSFGPMNLKLPKDEVKNRVEEALAYMNLKEYKNRPPHYLSGGEKKRVGIADILAMNPEVIIFDEPAGALDPVNGRMLEEVLFKLWAEKKTMIISTHDVDFAFRFADRAVVFCEGRILADDTPLAIFQNPDTVNKAHLKKPVLLEVFELLRAKGYFADEKMFPKNIKEMEGMIDKLPDYR